MPHPTDEEGTRLDRKPHIVPPSSYDELAALDWAVPEQRLLASVILRAVFDYQALTRYDRHHRRSARVFLFHDDPDRSDLRLMAEYLFADPDAFVRRLRRELRRGKLKPRRAAVPD